MTYFGGVFQRHGYADEILQRYESFLLESHNIAYCHARLVSHLLSGKVFLYPAAAKLISYLLGNLVRIVMQIVV